MILPSYETNVQKSCQSSYFYPNVTKNVPTYDEICTNDLNLANALICKTVTSYMNLKNYQIIPEETKKKLSKPTPKYIYNHLHLQNQIIHYFNQFIIHIYTNYLQINLLSNYTQYLQFYLQQFYYQNGYEEDNKKNEKQFTPNQFIQKKNSNEQKNLYHTKNRNLLQIPNLKSIARCFFTKPINFKLILIKVAYVLRKSSRQLDTDRTKLARQGTKTSS